MGASLFTAQKVNMLLRAWKWSNNHQVKAKRVNNSQPNIIELLSQHH